MRRGSFHFKDLPVEEAAESLERLTLWALGRTLNLHEDPPEPRDLATWNALMRRSFSKRWQTRPRRIIPTFRKDRNHHAWTHKQIRLAISPELAWMPKFFVATTGNLAWTLPPFELRMWEIVRAHLSNEMIFGNDLEANLGFRPPTLWALTTLALQGDGLARKRPFLGLLPSAQVNVGRRLAELAMLQVQTRNWADFWDQWILWHALRRWDRQVGSTTLAKHLHRLPLCSEWKKVPHNPHIIVSTWRDKAPDRLLQFLELKSPKPTEKKALPKGPPPLPRETVKIRRE